MEIQTVDKQIQQFLSSPAFAVVGASSHREKFGNKVLRCYLQHKKKVYAVNPKEEMIEGVQCFHAIADLPEEVKSLSIITPPTVTEKIVEQAIEKKIQNIWMQPGAESKEAIRNCQMHNINVIGDGSCILQFWGFHEE